MYAKKENIYPVYVSKHNSNRKKKVILLRIPHGERSYYISVKIKTLPALLRGITSKYYVGFYCLNCSHSFATENKHESHKKVFEDKDFCNVVMSFKDAKILEFNQYQKSDKATFIIYPDFDCLIEKIDECKKYPENSSTTKLS